MPPLIAALPIIAAVAGLAGTGVGLGLELSNQPGSPKPVTPTAPTPAQNAVTQNQEKALIGQQLPNVLSQTSGLANPEYLAQMAQLLAGTAGSPGSTGAAQQAIAQAFGLPPGAFTGGGGATPASRFTPAGANPNTSAATDPTTPVSLSEFVKSFI